MTVTDTKKKTFKVAVAENYVEVLTIEAETDIEAEDLAMKTSSFNDPDIIDSNEVHYD